MVPGAPVEISMFLIFTAFLFCASKYPPFIAGRGDVTVLTALAPDGARTFQPDPGIGSTLPVEGT